MRRFLILLVVIAAGGGGWWWWSHRAAPADSTTATADQGQRRGGPASRGTVVPVLVAKATAKDVPIYLDGIGTVQASAAVTVKSQVDGQLASVNFVEGQDVNAGDVLAQIDPRAYQAALDLAVDEANLANARIDLARYAKLAANAYTSAQQADTQRATVAQLVAQVAGDQANIDTARVNLGFTTIKAPVTGRIGLRQVDPGNIVHASDATGLCTITTLRPINVLFTLPQQSLRAAQLALTNGHAEVIALAQDTERTSQGPTGADGGVLDHGELLVIDNAVDPSTGTIKLKAVFPNAQLALWPGGFVNVRLRVQTVQGALTVPPVAIQRGPQGAYVYVAKPDNTAERRPVQLGHQDDSTAIVTGGLTEGDQVVTDGASRLSDAAKINVVTPPPAAAAPLPQRPRQRQRPQQSN